MFAASIIALGLASFATAAPVASSSSSAEEYISTYLPASSTWTSRFANATYTANATVTVAELTVTVTAVPTTSTSTYSASSAAVSSSSSSASSSTSEWVAPSSSSTSKWSAPSSSSSTSAWTAPSSSAAVVYEAAAVKSTSTSAAAATTSKATAPSSGQFSGTATYYYQGGNPGSCGDYHGDNDFIVAVNSAQVANTCGKSLTITNTKTGATQNAIAADTCPTCSYGSLDLSSGLFAALGGGDMGQGVFPISWSFN